MHAFKRKSPEEAEDEEELYPDIRYNIFGQVRPKRETNPKLQITKKRDDESVINHYAHFLTRLLKIQRTFGMNSTSLVKCKRLKEINALFSHPRNQDICLRDHTGFCITTPSKNDGPPMVEYYRGLTKLLKECFYPEVDEDPIHGNTQNRKREDVYDTNAQTTCKYVGKDHGKKVHEQIEQYLLLLNTNESTDKQQLMNVFKSDIDPCVIRIISFCVSKKWLPICSEFMIFGAKFATSVDLICIDMDQVAANNDEELPLVLAELKTGYENQEYEVHKSDREFDLMGFEKIKNCPKNRHFLQIMGMLAILLKDYHVTITKSAILRVCPKARQIIKYDSPPWVYERSKLYKLYNILKNAAEPE